MKAGMPLLMCEWYWLNPISHCFQDIEDYWSNFVVERGCLSLFNVLVQDCDSWSRKIRNTRLSLSCSVKLIFDILTL